MSSTGAGARTAQLPAQRGIVSARCLLAEARSAPSPSHETWSSSVKPEQTPMKLSTFSPLASCRVQQRRQELCRACAKLLATPGRCWRCWGVHGALRGGRLANDPLSPQAQPKLVGLIRGRWGRSWHLVWSPIPIPSHARPRGLSRFVFLFFVCVVWRTLH